MTYVLDSSVTLKWVLAEADSAKAIRLRDEYVAGTHLLLAPDVFPPEIANALASAERQKRVRPGDALGFLTDILTAAPLIRPSAPRLPRAVELSLATGRAVYDCVYLALAEAEGCELVTPTCSSRSASEPLTRSSCPSSCCPDARSS